MNKHKQTKMKSTDNYSNKQYTFILKNIDTESIEKRFGITIISNIDIAIDKLPENVTKIVDLNENKNTQEIISFIDEAKKTHKCCVSMIDFTTKDRLNESSEHYDCFWCRNSIPKNIISIGCPIKYVYSQAIKSYYSEISKDNYIIKENITKNKQKKIEEFKHQQIGIIDKNYYITDGIFCSFNCCMAYITENKNNSLYNMSEMLLLKMYNDMYPSSIPSIEKAPHWRNLKSYGGSYTIEQFRASFNKIEYKNHGMVFDFPKFKSVGVMFEEKIKF